MTKEQRAREREEEESKPLPLSLSPNSLPLLFLRHMSPLFCLWLANTREWGGHTKVRRGDMEVLEKPLRGEAGGKQGGQGKFPALLGI